MAGDDAGNSGRQMKTYKRAVVTQKQNKTKQKPSLVNLEIIT